jgi:hypothetical protein
MEYIKRLTVLGLVVILCGCAGLYGLSDDKKYEEGYRQGVKENVNNFAENFYGNDFPYFNWAGPIIQNVKIPAHIENGVFIPEHFEPVMLQPGEWRSSQAYPISSKGGKNDNQNQNGYEVQYSNVDITVLPKAFNGTEPGSQESNCR